MNRAKKLSIDDAQVHAPLQSLSTNLRLQAQQAQELRITTGTIKQKNGQ